MKSIRLLFFASALLAVFSAAAQHSIFTNQPAPALRPSIIFIQCHGLGYGDLSCYGQTNFQTPNLDRLAAEGMRFEKYFASGTNLSQTLAALMTGKNSAGGETLAELLENSGYRTGLVGEWALPARPWTQGFEDFVGFVNADEGTNYFADHLWRFASDYSYDAATGQWEPWKKGAALHEGGKEMIYSNTGGKKGQYLPELFFNAAFNFIRINQPDKFNKFQPFFLLLDLPAPRLAAGPDEFPVPSDAPFSDEPWPAAAKNRAALITRLDGNVGGLFTQLEKLRLTNNVAIVFTSDLPPQKFANTNLNFLRPNGNQPDKNNVRLPMIVRWPEEVPAGKVSAKKWSAGDFLPTIAEMLQARIPKTEGASVLPAWRGALETNSPAAR